MEDRIPWDTEDTECSWACLRCFPVPFGIHCTVQASKATANAVPNGPPVIFTGDVRWNSIPVVKPSFPSNGGSRRRSNTLAAGFRVTTAAFSRQVPSLCVLPLQLLRTPLRRAQMCGALLFDLNIPPWRRNYPCTRVWERRLALLTDTQSEARFLRKTFGMILNPNLAFVLGICFTNIVNPTRQCSIMTRICPFKEDCTNLIEIRLQLECMTLIILPWW